MNLRPRFLLAMTLAGAVATPALAQTTAPSVGSPGSRTQSTASIPDFSGLWLHPGLGFGPPLSGPGPGRNKTRLPSGASNFNLVAVAARCEPSTPQSRTHPRHRGAVRVLDLEPV